MQTDCVQMEGLLIIADALTTELTTFIHKFAEGRIVCFTTRLRLIKGYERAIRTPTSS